MTTPPDTLAGTEFPPLPWTLPGQRLRALCEEHLAPKRVAEIAPGDVLLLRFTRHPQHLALAGNYGHPFSLIHAHAEAGGCVEHGADARWLRRIVAAYAFRQPGA